MGSSGSFSVTRRRFLRAAPAVAIGYLAPCPAWARVAAPPERGLRLDNRHTGEKLTTVYWTDGRYLPESLREIDYILRDYRNNQVHPIDVRLLDLLHALRRTLGTGAAFQVISGYRSPATNAMLRRQGHGVAKRSYHIRGMAIDVRLPDRDAKTVRRAALSLHAGGVGYYPRSGFVHVDVGPYRFW